MDDYYKILGISPLADEKQVRAAYRRLAKQYHPDAGAGSSADTFRAVQDAYDFLSDPAKRRKYDRSLEAESPAGARTPRQRYYGRAAHIDLREVIGSRQGTGTVQAEPVRPGYRREYLDDPFEEILEYFFRDFGF